MTDTDAVHREFEEWLPRAYRDGDKGDAPRFTKHNMEAAYVAGRAAAENDSKHAKHWRELCEAVNIALSGDRNHVSLWGDEERLFACVTSQCRGNSRITVEFYYQVPNEIREDLDAAIDNVNGGQR